MASNFDIVVLRNSPRREREEILHIFEGQISVDSDLTSWLFAGVWQISASDRPQRFQVMDFGDGSA